MTTNNEVLTQQEIVRLKHSIAAVAPEEFFIKVARAIEQAVLAKVQPAMPADAEDTARLNFLAEHARTVRRADDGRQNLIVWGHDFPAEGAGLRNNLNSMIDDARRRIEGE